MIKRILVPLDGSQASEAAVLKASDILRGKPDAFIAVLRVLELPENSPLFEPVDLANARAEERRQTSEYLDQLKEEYAAPHYTMETRIEAAEEGVANAIIKCAETENVDLIVLTSHGRTGLKKLLLGSVTEKVVRLSPCSVMIVK